jgi:lipid II:glycine glycyltransferase (peptidoglycan interpeptide bridge formation enzyme)
VTTEIGQDAWDNQVKELGGGILQSWAWGEFQKSLGGKVTRHANSSWMAQVVENDLIMGKKFWYSPRGPIGNTKQAADFLRETAIKDHKIVFLRLEPSEPIDLPPSPKEIQPKENWVVGLEGSEDELLVTMKPKHRYNINLAARKGVTIRSAEKKDFLDIWNLLLETSARGNFKLHPQNYYLQMWEKLGDNHLKIMLAEHEGQMLACIFISLFGKTATYLHGGSSDKNKQLMAPYLLHWEAMKVVKRLGYFNYDMGGFTEQTDHPWAGISRFKRGFGGFEVRYPGTFDMVLSPLWYNVYKNARKFRKLLK